MSCRVVDLINNRETNHNMGKLQYHHLPQENCGELDSHADTCVFDPALCYVMSELLHTVDVGGFHGDLEPIRGVPVGTVAIVYVCM